MVLTMILIKIIWQHRRDFKGLFECQECKYTEEINGYDDDYFHRVHIPSIKCGGCNKSSLDLGNHLYSGPKYPKDMVL